jgi:lipopolysaccharide transport system ATP-binding protein
MVAWPDGATNHGETAFAFLGVELLNQAGAYTHSFNSSEPIRVRLIFRVKTKLGSTRIGFLVATAEGYPVMEVYESDSPDSPSQRTPGRYAVTATIPANLLNEGQYLLSLNAGLIGVRNLCYLEQVISFFIIKDVSAVAHHPAIRRSCCLLPRLAWDFEGQHSEV